MRDKIMDNAHLESSNKEAREYFKGSGCNHTPFIKGFVRWVDSLQLNMKT